MRQLFNTLFFLAFAQLGLAQITVTSSTFPTAGDTLRYAFDDRPALDVKTFLGWLDATDLIVNQSTAIAAVFGVDTLVSHHFYNNTTKEVIAQLNFNTAQNQILSVRFKAPPRATVPVREVQPPTAQLQVIPNPVDAEIQLSFVPLISGKLRIELHDVLGRTLKTSQVEVIQQQKMRWQIPGQDLPNGIYTLVLSTADRQETVPLVVQH